MRGLQIASLCKVILPVMIPCRFAQFDTHTHTYTHIHTHTHSVCKALWVSSREAPAAAGAVLTWRKVGAPAGGVDQNVGVERGIKPLICTVGRRRGHTFASR